MLVCMQASSPPTGVASSAAEAMANATDDAPDSPRGIARDFYAATFTLNMRVMRDFFPRLTERGISPTQFKMLHRLLDQHEGEVELSVKALGEFHCLSVAATSRAVDGLVQHGFAERDECPADRRIKRVRITGAGRALLRELHATNVALLADFTETLTDRERSDLATALAPLLGRLGVRTSTEGPSR